MNQQSPSKPNVPSLLALAMPLILSGLASNLTIFIDRIILSRYSVDMMTHVAAVSNYSWLFLFSLTGITYISKVFVGQYNGAKHYSKSGAVTWQMLIFSVLSFVVFGLAYYFSPLIIPMAVQEHGLIYFQTLMLGGILWPIASSLCGFFIGSYQNGIVLIAILIANIVNVCLDLLWIPEYGTYGAALATVIATIAEVSFLFFFFLNKSNRKIYHTHNITFKPKLMLHALKLGTPEAASHFFEMAAWSAVITIISAAKGEQYLLVVTLAQTLFILFMFVYSELGNAVKSLAANYVGANRLDYIKPLIRSALAIHTTFMLSITLILFINPQLFLSLFSLTSESVYIQLEVIRSLKGVILFMFLDGIAYMFSSILAAYGDTLASMAICGVNMWLFLVLPTYLLVNYFPISPSTHPIVVLPLYGTIVSACYIFRYYSAPVKQLFITNQ